MSDNFDDYGDYYEEYDDSFGTSDPVSSDDSDEGGSAWDQDGLIADVRGEGGESGEPAPPNNRRKIIFGVVFVLFILPLICVACPVLFGGAAVVTALFSGEGVVEISSSENSGPPTETPIATFVPTAAVIIPPTETPLPTPTPTMAPPSATFLSPANGSRLTLGESVDLVVEVQDGNGITSVNVDGSRVGAQTYNGETTVTFRQRWAPENAGVQSLSITVRDRLGQLKQIDGINVMVVDRDFLERNAPTFNTLDSNVAVLRGLSLKEAVEPTLMGTDGVRRYLRNSEAYDEAEAEREMLVLSAFDFVPRGFDMYAMTIEYLGGSIAGFYDPTTKVFAVVSTDPSLDIYEQYVYVHELMHALQDQHFALEQITSSTGLYDDRALAVRALAEGEASLLQDKYIESGYFTAEQQTDIINTVQVRLGSQRQQFETSVPRVLSNAFWFPYEVGTGFATAVYDQNGGWAGLNNTWSNLPQSTEQIIHPDRYFAGDTPQQVSVADLSGVLGEGWTEIERSTFGEFFLREYLRQKLDEISVDTAATGWGGDQYAVYYNAANDQVVMTLRLAWDTAEDSQQFGELYTSYANAAYGTNTTTPQEGVQCRTAVETVCLAQVGNDWLIIRAPDEATAVAVLNAQ